VNGPSCCCLAGPPNEGGESGGLLLPAWAWCGVAWCGVVPLRLPACLLLEAGV
jgi:hypothetical protein